MNLTDASTCFRLWSFVVMWRWNVRCGRLCVQASDLLPEEVLLLRPRRGDQPDPEGARRTGAQQPAGGPVSNVALEPQRTTWVPVRVSSHVDLRVTQWFEIQFIENLDSNCAVRLREVSPVVWVQNGTKSRITLLSWGSGLISSVWVMFLTRLSSSERPPLHLQPLYDGSVQVLWELVHRDALQPRVSAATHRQRQLHVTIRSDSLQCINPLHQTLRTHSGSSNCTTQTHRLWNSGPMKTDRHDVVRETETSSRHNSHSAHAFTTYLTFQTWNSV